MSIMIGAAAVASAAGHSRGLGVATLITWLLTAGLGSYMLRTWIARGGLRRPPARSNGLPPAVIFGHFGLAVTGLMVWIGYLATGWAPLAWSAACLLMPVVGLGISMVTLWTPYPVASAVGTAGPVAGARDTAAAGGMLAAPPEDMLAGKLTDHVLASALTDDALAGKLADDVLARVQAHPSRAVRKPRGHLAPLIPAGHGLAAIATVLFALLTAVSTR